MHAKRPFPGLTFCAFYLATYLTNKYVLSVLKFTYPTLFQGWQTLIGGLLLHISWKLGWVEINSNSRAKVLAWLPSSMLFVGIIYAGSRALSRLSIPVFFTLHNASEVIVYLYQKCISKELTSPAKVWSSVFLLVAAGCLPFYDSQFDPVGYFWAAIHLFCVGSYKILHKAQKSSMLSDIDQQYLNYIFSMVLLAFASHPTGDLFRALEFPFLYFYRFHTSCCARFEIYVAFFIASHEWILGILFDVKFSETKKQHGSRTAYNLDFLCQAFYWVELEKPCWFTQRGQAHREEVIKSTNCKCLLKKKARPLCRWKRKFGTARTLIGFTSFSGEACPSGKTKSVPKDERRGLGVAGTKFPRVLLRR
ncbi:UDP-N-acetylglucosamine transporter TMEM241 isoform X2 [Macrotis lagotis]|uniref:UDP-N-acetylglucosamine transporter TMEM241 isoform X2 n=1 Tax=Macrotis lagotis TaxID=92651 RepID=UPI003D694F5D